MTEAVLHWEQLPLFKSGRRRPRKYAHSVERYRAYRQRKRQAKQDHLKVYHRSLTIEWETPQAFFDRLHAEFMFTLDVAAQEGNAKCGLSNCRYGEG